MVIGGGRQEGGHRREEQQGGRSRKGHFDNLSSHYNHLQCVAEHLFPLFQPLSVQDGRGAGRPPRRRRGDRGQLVCVPSGIRVSSGTAERGAHAHFSRRARRRRQRRPHGRHPHPEAIEEVSKKINYALNRCPTSTTTLLLQLLLQRKRPKLLTSPLCTLNFVSYMRKQNMF